MGRQKSIRVYHAWEGNNKFCCGGRLVYGPDVGSLFLTVLLIGGPATTFCVKMILRIRENDPLVCSFLTVAFTLTFMVFLFLFLTSSSDPGMVRRNITPPTSDESFAGVSQSEEWGSESISSMKLRQVKELKVNGHSVKVKYCETCSMFRPPRGSHCSVCNNCVEKFDHHCPWIGQCIGLRNYRYFIWFISSTTCLCISIFTFSCVSIFQQKSGLWNMTTLDISFVGLIFYCFVAIWFVGGLTAFHFYLICTNQTTNENFRRHFEKRKNPYNKGIMYNVREFCSPQISSQAVNFRDQFDTSEGSSSSNAYSKHNESEYDLSDPLEGSGIHEV